jgi:pimeloyl-ACP methyl ester carboxylesterase
VSGPKAVHFSVTHPERVSALVLVNSYAHYVREDDYPWGFPARSLDRYIAALRASWGTAAALDIRSQPSFGRALPGLVRPLGSIHRRPRPNR